MTQTSENIKDTRVELSVIVLCYGSGERVYGFVSGMKELLTSTIPSWEIILVGNYDEGGTDITPLVVKKIASLDTRIKAVALPKKGMMGWDLKSGLSAANGKYLCFIDGDEQVPPEDIIRVHKKIKEEGLDLVLPQRIRRYDGFFRVVNSRAYNRIARLMFPIIKVMDINAKPKVFTKNIYEKLALKSDDWFIDTEIIIKSSALGLKIGQVPSEFKRNQYRRSFVNLTAIFEFLKNLTIVRLKGRFNKW